MVPEDLCQLKVASAFRWMVKQTAVDIHTGLLLVTKKDRVTDGHSNLGEPQARLIKPCLSLDQAKSMLYRVYTLGISYFYAAMTKIPVKSNLRMQGFLWLHLRGHCPWWGWDGRRCGGGNMGQLVTLCLWSGSREEFWVQLNFFFIPY